MRVRLAFGARGLDVDVPEQAVVLRPVDLPALADEEGAVREALREPVGAPAATLDRLVSRGDRVVVVFPDLTRPMPNRTVLPPLLEALREVGAGPERVELLCATGTHRAATPEELAELVGPAVAGSYRVHNHVADDGRHVAVGSVDGVPVLLDRRYVEADVRIVTGFVEPHFFAGLSGGAKGVCPGLAATSTILEAHSPARIADPRATWMLTEGNPVHDFVRAATALLAPDLSVDVTIDRARRLTAVFAGPLPAGHAAACELVSRSTLQPVASRFDVVLTTNGGYPLDRNLYQAVKGMSAAERVVRDGGSIIIAAACADGLPEGGGFARLLERAARAEDPIASLVGAASPRETDRWQAQLLGRVLTRATVGLHAEGLADDEIRRAQLHPVADVVKAVDEALVAAGPGASLCVLPQGPLTVPTAPAQ